MNKEEIDILYSFANDEDCRYVYDWQSFDYEEICPLKCSKEMLDIQGHNGNYNYDSYMLGIYNGMEYIIALFETREPIFKSGKDIEFISDKTQQKEFINYINSYIELLKNQPDLVEEGQKDILEEILSKYKEIIEVSNETYNN